MVKTKNFSELIVWQKAHQFVLNIYVLTKGFPREERFGLTSQLRRAAISITANIAEGYSKRGLKDKMKFLNTSQGLLSECKYCLILIRDLKYASIEKLEQDLEEVSKLLNSYSRGIARNSQLLNSSVPTPNSSPPVMNCATVEKHDQALEEVSKVLNRIFARNSPNSSSPQLLSPHLLSRYSLLIK